MANPTKKQRELLNFIDGFIKGNGYSPSFREIMRALDYKSVSTVAAHVDGLVARGWLIKKDNSARTLEVVEGAAEQPWWKHLEYEAKKREGQSGEMAQKEREILQQALDIVRK